MQIFWRLLFAHLLCDFTFQTNNVNRWKRSSIWGMAVHCGIHPFVSALLTLPFLGDVWVSLPHFPLTGWRCLGIIFATHFLEDEWRVYSIRKHGTPDNTLYFVWDQIIHYAVIFAVIPSAAFDGGIAALIPEKWPVLGCLFVMATHAATVLVYFVEKDMYSRPFPPTSEKYFSMGERLVLALLFLVPGVLGGVLIAFWIAGMYYIRSRKILDLSRVGLYLGGSLAIICGLASRFVYYL